MSLETVVLLAVMAMAAGLVGAFAVMRGMALAADPMSHVALPGIGVAIALHMNPVLGAVVALLFGALLVWALEDAARATTETVIGVVFTAALAIGSLMTSGESLIDALFGGAGAPGLLEAGLGVIAAVAIVAFMLTHKNQLVVMLVSPDVARTAGVNVRRVDLLYLVAFALTIALGLRYLGVLLMGALIIVPPATAKRLARTLDQMLAASVVLAVGATLFGSWLASVLHRESGPLIVLTAATWFLLSLLVPPSVT